MLFRALVCCAALIAGLLLGLNVSVKADPAEACDGAACPAEVTRPAARPSKPLDIMKFMREQAASTRGGEKTVSAKPPLKPQPQPQPKPHVVAAKPKPLPTAAASSFAAQPAPEVDVVAEDEFNAIDRAGDAAPAETAGRSETVGAPPAADPPVQMVDAGELNAIDKAADTAPQATGQPPAPQPVAETQSWTQWLLSAVESTFAALATAVHRLIG